MNVDELPTVIIGGRGKTGGRVADRLLAIGRPVRVASRSSGSRFDWADESTWADALDGAGSAYVVYHPDVAMAGSDARMSRLVALARRAGTRRLVMLSGRGEPGAQLAEEAAREAMPGASVVRASWFDQNFSEGHFAGYVMEGVLALPVPMIGEPFIDVDDVADVAVACLTQDGHEGCTYDVTGPELLTFRDLARIISERSGRELAFQQITMAQFDLGAAEAGVPQEVRDLLAMLFGEILDGRNESVTDDVRQVLGRDAGSFAAYVDREVRAGRWPSP